MSSQDEGSSGVAGSDVVVDLKRLSSARRSQGIHWVGSLSLEK